MNRSRLLLMGLCSGMDMDDICIAAPEALGFDSGRLARVEALLYDRYVGPGILPHAQLLVSREEQPVLRATMGAARESGAPLAPDAIFRIASMTKPLTSVAFLMLMEQGRVALDDPVHRILPEFHGAAVRSGGGNGVPFTTVPTDAPMRMIDLLRHTSGLTYSFQERTPIDRAYAEQRLDTFHQDRDSDDFIAALAALPLEFSPGSRWNYSVSTDVLGVVIERVSGMGLADYCRSHIFEPLGMADTLFALPEDRADRLTDAWQFDPGGGRSLYDRGEKSRWRIPRRFWSGGGGVLSTTADYHRFCRMMMRGGELDGVRLLSPKTVALMTANHLPGGSDLTTLSQSMFSESQNAGVGFGLGVAVTQDPAAAMMSGTAGEYNWGGMFSTFFFVDPVERIIAVFMTQVMPSTILPIRRDLKTLIYAALTDSRA